MEREEAMKILKDFHDKSALFSVRTALDTVIPELKESEDEKIRNEIILYIGAKDDISLDTHNKWVSWLEKQSEQKYIPKYKIGDYVKNTNYKGEPIYEIVYMDKECYICEYRGKENMGDKAVMHFAFDNPYLRLVEQKPATWSEEDDKILKSIIINIENLQFSEDMREKYHHIPNANKSYYQINIDWLKSIKERIVPQPKQVWKPSDAQILALDEVYKTHGANNVCRRIIFNLMNDLKKLRGE